MRWRARHDVKKGRLRATLSVFIRDLLRGLRDAALVAGCGVLVNQALTGSAIEQLDRGQSVPSAASGSALERGTERGLLGAVADRSSA